MGECLEGNIYFVNISRGTGFMGQSSVLHLIECRVNIGHTVTLWG